MGMTNLIPFPESLNAAAYRVTVPPTNWTGISY